MGFKYLTLQECETFTMEYAAEAWIADIAKTVGIHTGTAYAELTRGCALDEYGEPMLNTDQRQAYSAEQPRREVQCEVNIAAFKVPFEHAVDLACRNTEIEWLKKEVEREQEWKPYVDIDNVQQSDYEQLRGDSSTHVMTDAEAKDLLYKWYGFAPEKGKILRTIPTFEVNWYCQLRKTSGVGCLPPLQRDRLAPHPLRLRQYELHWTTTAPALCSLRGGLDMKQDITITRDYDLHNTMILRFQKRCGKLGLSEIEDLLRYESGQEWCSHYAILLNCSEVTLEGSGFDIFGENLSDEFNLYPIKEGEYCPIHGKFIPLYLYCPTCGTSWKDCDDNVEKSARGHACPHHRERRQSHQLHRVALRQTFPRNIQDDHLRQRRGVL